MPFKPIPKYRNLPPHDFESDIFVSPNNLTNIKIDELLSKERWGDVENDSGLLETSDDLLFNMLSIVKDYPNGLPLSEFLEQVQEEQTAYRKDEIRRFLKKYSKYFRVIQ